MNRATILNLPIHTLRARLGGKLTLSYWAGVWRCNGASGRDLAGTIAQALQKTLVVQDGLAYGVHRSGGLPATERT